MGEGRSRPSPTGRTTGGRSPDEGALVNARSKLVGTVVVAGLAAALALAALAASSDRSPVDSSDTHHSAALGPAQVAGTSATNDTNGNDDKTFQISGQVSGLYPGAQKQLGLTVSNPNNFAIKVTALTITVGNPGVAGCSAANVVATNFSGSLLVPKKTTASQALPIKMIANAANACQGVTFPLSFGGTAQKA